MPEPPRHFQPHTAAPGIERDRLLHLGADGAAQFAKILDAAEMDVRRFVPGIRQVFRARHMAAEKYLQADAPMAEVRKRHDAIAADAQHMIYHPSRPARRLHSLQPYDHI